MSDAPTPARPAGGEPREEIMAERGDAVWEAIWQAIRRWDIQRDSGEGYAGATGTDVQRIYEAVRAAASPAGGPPGERERSDGA